MCPAEGCSNPAISRRQVVFPDPDGPSSEKNSPSAILTLTLSTAFTVPKARLTPSKTTAGVSAGVAIARSSAWRTGPRRGGGARVGDVLSGPSKTGRFRRSLQGWIYGVPERTSPILVFPPPPIKQPTPCVCASSSAAEYRDVIGYPAIVRNAFLLRGALRHRRPPEADLREVVRAVGLAALGTEQVIPRARGRHYRY